MPHVTVTRVIKAPLADVWASWDDYANIYRFNPNLTKSYLIGENGETGLGATRQCDMVDGKNYIRERIVEHRPQQRLVVDIYDGSLPLKQAQAEVSLRAVSQTETEISFTMRFTPKMGLLGRLMVPLMKPQFRKSIVSLMDGNQAYVERGELVNAA
ncbi:MAG: SRPBCC family protein [Pelagimonas sp.]|uniref:SRPBCC family protein n=1 Tax=Pelagimonas sp. TaxID=2073170 RepID=UPI003D6B2A00